MTGLHAFHLIMLGLWGGVILVEVVFEGAGLAGKLAPKAVADLHRWTDRFLEIPLLVAIVTSGLLLWSRANWTPDLLPKAVAGLGAITANVVCVVFVERRANALEPKEHTMSVVWTAAPGFPLGIAALILGGFRAAWW